MSAAERDPFAEGGEAAGRSPSDDERADAEMEDRRRRATRDRATRLTRRERFGPSQYFDGPWE